MAGPAQDPDGIPRWLRPGRSRAGRAGNQNIIFRYFCFYIILTDSAGTIIPESYKCGTLCLDSFNTKFHTYIFLIFSYILLDLFTSRKLKKHVIFQDIFKKLGPIIHIHFVFILLF